MLKNRIRLEPAAVLRFGALTAAKRARWRLTFTLSDDMLAAKPEPWV